jgi:hypothetical protein
MPAEKIAANGVSVSLRATLLSGRLYGGYSNRALIGGLTCR